MWLLFEFYLSTDIDNIKVYSRGLHKTTLRIQKGCEPMTNAKQTNCAKYARGPPK